MKALIIYDTNYGNTKLVAETICRSLDLGCSTVTVSGLSSTLLETADLIIIGSPVIAWRPSDKISGLISYLKEKGLKGIKAAAFDTRLKSFLSGGAAGNISRGLKISGAMVIALPAFFYVQSRQGPLFDGELEKAKRWAKDISDAFKK